MRVHAKGKKKTFAKSYLQATAITIDCDIRTSISRIYSVPGSRIAKESAIAQKYQVKNLGRKSLRRYKGTELNHGGFERPNSNLTMV